MTTDLAARVDAGARLLDEKRPGWHREIAMDKLAMENCRNCILGQVYGDFENGLFVLRIDWTGISTSPAYLMGFDRDRSLEFEEKDGKKAEEEFNSLADLWRAEIRKRLEAEA